MTPTGRCWAFVLLAVACACSSLPEYAAPKSSGVQHGELGARDLIGYPSDMGLVLRGAFCCLAAVLLGCADAEGNTCNARLVEDQPAVFEFACGPTTFPRVALSGTCVSGYAYSTPNAQVTQGVDRLFVRSLEPGPCHVVLSFATGFVFSADVTFTLAQQEVPSGCPVPPPYTVPTQHTFAVNNPNDTCIDGGR